MQCKQEDKENIEIFWCIFNKASKEMHGDDEKFFPAGWCTDMASGNFIGLVKIYCEDILGTVKGCEFHFRDSVNRKAKLFGELKEKFFTEALSLVTAFDVRDSFLLESLLCGLENGSFVVGYGSNQGVMNEIRSGKNVKLTETIGQDIIDFGENAKRFLFTNQHEGFNPPKRKRNSDEVLLLKRI